MCSGMESEVDLLSGKMEEKIIVSLDAINWEESAKDFEKAVLLKMTNNRPIQKGQLADVINKVWKLSSSVTFYKVERSILLVNLGYKKDQDKILEGRSWSVEGMAILIQKWESGMTGEAFNCKKINVWTQLYGLPFELRNAKDVEILAGYAGKVKGHKGDSEVTQSSGIEFMRVKLELDVTKAILPGLFLTRPNRNPTWVSMKYERLPLVCFQCG